jgi:hypothetical protein
MPQECHIIPRTCQTHSRMILDSLCQPRYLTSRFLTRPSTDSPITGAWTTATWLLQTRTVLARTMFRTALERSLRNHRHTLARSHQPHPSRQTDPLPQSQSHRSRPCILAGKKSQTLERSMTRPMTLTTFQRRTAWRRHRPRIRHCRSGARLDLLTDSRRTACTSNSTPPHTPSFLLLSKTQHERSVQPLILMPNPTLAMIPMDAEIRRRATWQATSRQFTFEMARRMNSSSPTSHRVLLHGGRCGLLP